MSKPAERNVHNADTPDFSVPDDGHGTPTSNTIGILLDACQTAKRITEALLPRSPAPMSWREHGGKPSHLLDMSHRTTFHSSETPCRTTRIPSSPVSVAMGSIT